MSERTRDLAAIGLLVVVTAITLIWFDRPLIRGDGVAYLAWIDTLVLDQDIDFSNQLEKLAPVNSYQIAWNAETEKPVNIFPFGVAIFQGPFYAAGHAFAQNGIWNANPDYFYAMQGVSQAYSLWMMIGANVLAVGTILIGWWVARQFVGRYSAVLLAWGVYMGTPLIYYASISPLNSHNPGAFAATAFIALLLWCEGTLQHSNDGRQTHGWQWILLGIAGGLMIVTRWQLLIIVILGFGLLSWRKQWRGIAIAAVTTTIVMLPLPIVWNELYGSPFVVPFDAATGGSFFGRPVNSWLVLRETVRHSPIVLFSVVGVWFLWQRSRAWAIYATTAILLEAVVNGSTLDWWGGETYGMRRMSELYPFFLLTAAALFSYTPVRTWWRNNWKLVTRGAFALILFYTAVYFTAFIDFTWTNQLGVFIESPEIMLRHFWSQPNRWQVLREVMAAHVGPAAWGMPGP
ncbi:MAG: hypothetical protein M9918_10770 [Anaerolineae bacterium]|nr:hypothetical protein [Anaerolineae bacterium]